ncbi:hypothetical protein ABW20_dc0101975 [Dactylellina cionopaga]|nr:hypothetical protein ABW20_dc0101975 [Dactylellina cionopaga]
MATDGIIAVNKPGGRTSAQLIRDIQRIFKNSEYFSEQLQADKSHKDYMDKTYSNTRQKGKRWGKTGVLILGLGSGTKKLQKYLDCTKEYEAVAIFGASTDSYDREGKITSRKPYSHITREAVEGVLDKFRGDIFQRPPMFSALNLNGKRLYEYAREGIPIPVEIKKRPCTISSLEITDFEEGKSGHKWEYPTEEASEMEKAAMEAYQKVGMNPELKESEDLKAGLELDPTIVSDADVAAGEKRKADVEEKKANKKQRYYDRKKAAAAAKAEAENGNKEGESAEVVEGEDEEKEDTPPPPQPVYHEDGKPPVVHLKMTVSRGTYVRSIVHDIGEALGSAATLVALKRSRQGEYEVGQNVIDWEDFISDKEEVWAKQVQEELEKQREF